ncbi:hypothetical protein AB0B01_07645 [Streptomyces sp. NPDC044571]|uniref:hypothetical protein n=1 Tax=Streptomyces sp. NPDC044571 TaxID=3155371 RepID=UPI00340C30E0
MLQQMEELMAALNADLSQLDADLQSSQASQASQPSADRTPDTSTIPGGPAPESERPTYRSL